MTSSRCVAEDRALLAGVQAGDPVAEHTFYDVHVETIYRMVWRMVGDADWAKDLTQDTFIRAFERAGQYRGEGSARGWMRSIARSVVLNAMGRQRIRVRCGLGEDEVPIEGLAAPPVEPVAFELRDRLAQALAQLSDKYRSPATLYYVQGLPHAEIAAALGISVRLSKVRLHRARARLRALLAEYAQDWLGSNGGARVTDGPC